MNQSPRMPLSCGLPGLLCLRFGVALVVMLLLLTFTFFTSRQMVERAERNTVMIQTAAEQLAYSQTILHLAKSSLLHNTHNVKSSLLVTLRNFEANHAWLLAQTDLPEEVLELLDREEDGLSEIVAKYLMLGQMVARGEGLSDPEAVEAHQQLKTLAQTRLWSPLNELLRCFEVKAVASTRQNAHAQELAIGLSLVVLVFIVFGVLTPAMRENRQIKETLASRERDLARTKDEVAVNIQALSDYADKLSNMAYHDTLTGLANRTRLHEQLDHLLAKRGARRRMACVMQIDLDLFKQINDTAGHAVGDAVLRHVAGILREIFGHDAVVARTGGDEFVAALMIHADWREAEARRLADSVVARVSEPVTLLGVECRVGASVGIAFASCATTTADDIIANADMALYEAKHAGRGAARIFRPEMRAGLEARRMTVLDLERALELEQFEPVFQPQISLEDGQIAGLEILARWARPDRGMVPRSEFMGLADEIGILDEIDWMVAEKGLETLARLRLGGWRLPRASINVTPRLLRAEDYAARLSGILARNRLEPGDVAIELSESTLIDDPSDRAVATINRLVDMGVRVVLADYGTGFASLANLADLRIHGLKIDKELVANCQNPRSLQIVEAVLSLAQTLQLEVTAEGVETPTQYATMRRLKCHLVQGFGLSKPQPAHELERWLAEYGRASAPLTA